MADLVVTDSAVSGLIGEYTERRVGKLEKLLGPELARVIIGIFTNPLSIIGFGLILFFILVAIFAPVIIPPLENTRDPFKILRDGYSPYPKAPGALWNTKAPALPFWYKTFDRQGPMGAFLRDGFQRMGPLLWGGLGNADGY